MLAIIDSSSLLKMIEGKEGAEKEIVNRLYDAKKDNVPIKAMTTLSCFLRAIWKASPDTSIKSIHKIMDVVEIVPLICDYKNEEDVRNQVIELANKLAGP